MMLLIVTCVAGIFLGLKYSFPVLIPAAIIGSSICGASALTNGLSVSATIVDVLTSGVTLQAGFMLGLTGREFVNQLWSTVVGLSGNEYR